MYLIITYLISVLILSIIFFLSQKYKLLLDEPQNNVRKIHSKVVIKIGGMSMLSFYLTIFYVTDPILLEIIFFSLFFMIIGLVADLNNKFSSTIRFIIMTVIILIFLLRNNFILDDLDHNVLNAIFNSYELLPYIFTIMGLLFCINGLVLKSRLPSNFKTDLLLNNSLCFISNDCKYKSFILFSSFLDLLIILFLQLFIDVSKYILPLILILKL